MSEADTRVVILQQKLADAKMHPSERDALADDLEFANQINGDTDPLKQMIKKLMISGVRRELLAHERQSRHFSECPIASQITKDADGNRVMPWDKTDKGTTAADTSSISGWGVTLKGPVVRLAVASTAIIIVVWLMLTRQDAALRKDLRDSIVPAFVRSIKNQAQP